MLPAGVAAARAAAPVCGAGCKAAPAGSGALFVVSGHGFGHGVGMSQYGAYGYAQHGWTFDQILAHYYPGTTLGTTSVTTIKVLLADGRTGLQISSAAPLRVRDGSGTVHPLPAGSYGLGPGLKLALGTQPAQALPPPLTFQPGSAPLKLGRLYRGSIEVDVVGGKLRAIDVVPLEQYLDGVVPAEMPSTWAPEALKAQAVASRSYALATRRVAAPFDLYADGRSQLYLGVSAERPATTAAVRDTAGQVVLAAGRVARTSFFSSSGGRTANASDVWSVPPVPYLVSVPDPYDTLSPYHNWGPLPFTGSAFARTFHVSGAVTDVHTALDGSGRVKMLQLLGPKGEVDVSGATATSALNLRSTWFAVGVLSLARAASAKPVVFGSRVQLTAVVRGLSGVALEQRPAGGAWQAVGPVTPAAPGPDALSATPAATTDYRLATASLAAGPLRVPVMPRVRLASQSGTAGLRGSVRPLLAGATVEIQRRAAGGKSWTTVASTTVGSSGSFDAAFTVTSGTYRALVPATRGLATGTSPSLTTVAG